MHSSVELTVHSGQEHAPAELSRHAVDDSDVVRGDLTHKNAQRWRAWHQCVLEIFTGAKW